MKVLVAGSTGVIGRPLVRRLLDGGHDVIAMTRRPDRARDFESSRVRAAVCDVFDADGVRALFRSAAPDIVINQLTSIPARIDPRRVARAMGSTNRLRTEGARILVDAAVAAGTPRIVSQSIAFLYDPAGRGLANETERLYETAPPAFVDLVAAMVAGERATLETEVNGTVLRYGYFYGPGTIYAPDGTCAADVRARKVPLVGMGSGVFSFVHVDDAAAATVLAVEGEATGIYNVVDDDPAPMRRWLPEYARALDAPPPRRVPAWLGRLAAGPYGAYLTQHQRGASNARAKQQLGWQPRARDWKPA